MRVGRDVTFLGRRRGGCGLKYSYVVLAIIAALRINAGTRGVPDGCAATQQFRGLRPYG